MFTHHRAGHLGPPFGHWDIWALLFGRRKPLCSNRQHSEINDCLEDNREDCQNCHYHYICTIIIDSSYSFRFPSFFCVLCFSVKVKLFVLLLCLCAILPGKAVPEMTYTVSGGTLNATYSRLVAGHLGANL